MDIRRELIAAIGELTAFERAQLLLFLLEDERDPFRAIDGGKWRWHEARRQTPEGTWGTYQTPPTVPPVPEGEGLP